MFKSYLTCCGDKPEAEETSTEDGNKSVVKDGTTKTPTIIKPTIIKPTIIKPIPKPTPNDKQPNPSKDTTDVPASSRQGIPSIPQFEIDCLNEHNRLRALHGCPPLILSQKLNATAKDWAIRMADANTMKHNEEYTYGENLYMSSGFTLNGSRPVQSWYREIKDYNYQKPDFSPETGHFTQVIWKDSKELGVGVEKRGNTTWVVAHYNPPGNVLTMFGKNVPRIVRKK